MSRDNHPHLRSGPYYSCHQPHSYGPARLQECPQIIGRRYPRQTGRHQPPWRNVSKIFFENRSSGGVVELGRHQPPHRSVSEISEEIEATEVPAVA